MPRPRVLHLITSLGVGGAEVLLQQLLGAWDDPESHRVLVLRRSPGQELQLSGTGQVSRAPNVKRHPLELWESVRRHQPHVVHTWLVHGGLAGLLLPRGGAPLLLSVHHHDLSTEPLRTRAAGAALASLHPLADLTVFTSHAARRAHRGRGWRGRSTVIPNGVKQPRPERARVDVLRRELDLPSDAEVVLHLARRHPQKDHETGLRALSLVLHERPSLYGVFAGRGVDNGQLAALADELGCRDRLRLLGQRNDVPDLLGLADVLLTSSRAGETSPLVVSQALAVGLPVVGTDVGDTGRMIGAAGAVVPPGRPEALGQALSDLLSRSSSERHALRNRAVQRWREDLDVAVCAEKYAELYATLSRAGTKA